MQRHINTDSVWIICNKSTINFQKGLIFMAVNVYDLYFVPETCPRRDNP